MAQNFVLYKLSCFCWGRGLNFAVALLSLFLCPINCLYHSSVHRSKLCWLLYMLQKWLSIILQGASLLNSSEILCPTRFLMPNPFLEFGQMLIFIVCIGRGNILNIHSCFLYSITVMVLKWSAQKHFFYNAFCFCPPSKRYYAYSFQNQNFSEKWINL